MLEPTIYKNILLLDELYIEKYTEILMFVFMAGRDICEFTRAVRNF